MQCFGQRAENEVLGGIQLSMASPGVSVAVWRGTLLVVVAILAALQVWSLTNWRRFDAMPDSGTLAVSLGPVAGGGRRPIEARDANSPLAAEGARSGELLLFDRNGDALRKLGTDESIGLTIVAGDQARHVFVTPVAKAPWDAATPFEGLAQIMMWPSTTITLAIGAMIGWRRGHTRAMRVLSLALMAGSVNFFYSRLPGGAIQDWSGKLLWPCAYFVAFVGFPYFALSIPDRLPLLRNRIVRNAFVTFSFAWLFFVIGLSTDRFGAHWQWPALVRPGAALPDFLELGTAAIAICAPWFAWKRSVGVERQRIAWIGACLG